MPFGALSVWPLVQAFCMLMALRILSRSSREVRATVNRRPPRMTHMR